MWNVLERGFLPISDPITFLPVSDIRNTELVYTWENLSNVLPYYLKEECVREELVCNLRKVTQSYYHGCIDNLGGPSAHERTFLLLAYFSTAYINSPEGKKKSKLPKEIVVPFARVAHLVGRFPVLDYTSLVLYNWKAKDIAASLTRDNIEILQTFTDLDCEREIITSLVEMESIVSELIRNMSNPFQVAEKIGKINKVLQKTWDNITLEFLDYWSSILADYGTVKYEQWRETEVYPCDVFLQTPLLSVLYKYLEINFQNDYLRKRNEDVLLYQVPSSHRIFIGSISSIRKKCAEHEYYREAYNYCLSELIKLRNHLLFRSYDSEMGIIATKELANYYF